MLRSLFSSSPRPAKLSIETLDLSLAGLLQPVVVRRSSRARRYTLRVKPSTRELILTMPSRGSLAAARDFLSRHEGWIAARLTSLPETIPFEDGACVPVRGVPHRIRCVEGRKGVAWLERDASGDAVIAVTGDPAHVARRVRDFLKRLATADLKAATHAYAARLGVSVKRISIKDTTSRWGSCTSEGAMSYSWRIVMAPPFVLDYLAAHEVAHRREMNHSRRFWALVREICKDTDAAEVWLKTNGSSLHRYG